MCLYLYIFVILQPSVQIMGEDRKKVCFGINHQSYIYHCKNTASLVKYIVLCCKYLNIYISLGYFFFIYIFVC